jgi:cellulose synthase/poly-beta-1,6-N-acetylglucosamine synthase-like glycosyltransferase
MIRFLDLANQTLFYYYLICNLTYLTMLIIALKTSAMHQRRLQSISPDWIKGCPLAPPISILVPAHNEEKSICPAVRNLLDLDYPGTEVIIINDGSTDKTLQKIQEGFCLRPVRTVYVQQAKSARVRGLYRSEVDPRLVVVDKEPGGSKADAVNAGLNAATAPYVCVVDADSVLERDALLRIMVPVMADPKRVVAVGGIVRVLNGSEVEAGRIRRVRLPRKSIEAIQVVEYLRAFLIGREAWALGNMLMIISGAFGVFRTDLVRTVGGYRASAIGEDFDLVARFHRYLRDNHTDYQIQFVPDPVCWTEVPSDLRSLGRQRSRWQKGLLDVLWPNRDMLFRRRYGRIGWLALPYLWLFELLAASCRTRGNPHDCLGGMARRSQPRLLSAVPVFRLGLRHHDLHWLCLARGTDLQTIQRLERRGSAGEPLLPGTLPLQAIAYAMAIARALAVPARRHGLEADEATRTGAGWHRRERSISGRSLMGGRCFIV